MRSENATSGSNQFNNIASNGIMVSCRTCMAQSDNMTCIFEPDRRIVDEIKFCTGLQFIKDDELPSRICSVCLTNLSIAYKFKTSCLLADRTFRKPIINNIKTENDNTDFDCEYEDTCTKYEVKNYQDSDKVKQELVEEKVLSVDSGARKSSRVRVKKESGCTKLESNPIPKCPLRKPRGTKPRRMKKYKFRKLWCEPCSIQFTSKEENDNHKREKHKESEHWVCEICGKVFIHRASHYTHIKSHLPPKYACDQCDYKTWHKHDLVKHIRIHTGTKLYQCEFCTCSFYTSSNLTVHIRRSHMNLRPHQCTICLKSFFDKTKLNRHIDSHNEVKRFECEVCRACFTRRCYWKKHLFRQHNITTPRQRPGRQKTNMVIGEDLIQFTKRPPIEQQG